MWCGHVSGLPWYTKACYKNGKIMLCIFSLLDFFQQGSSLLFHTQESVYLYLGFTWVHTIDCEWVYLNICIWRLLKAWCDMKEIFLAIGRKWFGVDIDFILLGWISLWKKPFILRNWFSNVRPSHPTVVFSSLELLGFIPAVLKLVRVFHVLKHSNFVCVCVHVHFGRVVRFFSLVSRAEGN